MGQKIAIKLPCLTELDWQEGNKKREDCKFVFIQAETFGLFPSLFCRPNGCKFFNKEYVMFAFLKPDFEHEWNEADLQTYFNFVNNAPFTYGSRWLCTQS